MFQVKGKVALITGAVSGIGLACVKELLRNTLKGIALVDIDRNKIQTAIEKIEEQYGKDRVIGIKADVGDREQMKDAFETTVETFKQLDIVINNAGIIQELQWEKCVAVNLVGVLNGSFLAMETYLPKYKSGSEGVIVNTGSIASLIPLPEGPVYSATKAAVVQFTRALGSNIRYQRHKVKVMAVCPGFTHTDMLLITEDQANEPYKSRFLKLYDEGCKQTVQELASNVVGIIKEAPNGSIWTVIGGQKHKVEFPKI